MSDCKGEPGRKAKQVQGTSGCQPADAMKEAYVSPKGNSRLRWSVTDGSKEVYHIPKCPILVWGADGRKLCVCGSSRYTGNLDFASVLA